MNRFHIELVLIEDFNRILFGIELVRLEEFSYVLFSFGFGGIIVGYK